MRLYFLRHADAEERRPGTNDADRPLSAKGRRQADEVADWVRRHEITAAAIVSSPLVRARETAEPVARALGLPVREDERLGGGRLTLDALDEVVREVGSPDSLMLVGHEPDFSDVIGELTGGQVNMRKAGLALVVSESLESSAGVLEWLIPAALRV